MRATRRVRCLKFQNCLFCICNCQNSIESLSDRVDRNAIVLPLSLPLMVSSSWIVTGGGHNINISLFPQADLATEPEVTGNSYFWSGSSLIDHHSLPLESLTLVGLIPVAFWMCLSMPSRWFYFCPASPVSLLPLHPWIHLLFCTWERGFHFCQPFVPEAQLSGVFVLQFFWKESSSARWPFWVVLWPPLWFSYVPSQRRRLNGHFSWLTPTGLLDKIRLDLYNVKIAVQGAEKYFVSSGLSKSPLSICSLRFFAEFWMAVWDSRMS